MAPEAVMESRGSAMVELPAGAQTVILRYQPTSFVVGAAVSGLSIPLALAVFWRRRRQRSL